MKNIFKFSALAAAGVAAIVSCNKVQDTAPAVKTGRTVMLTVGSESKTLLHSDGQVYWLGTDKLCVFDNSAQSFQFTFTGTSNTSPTGTFECSDYTGSTPVYAVHFDRNTIGDAGYDGTKVITGQLNAAQNFMNKKSFAKDAAFAIGKIVPDGNNYSVETMKNCFSLIKFKLINADIDTITVRGLGDEVLAGWVDVDCDKLAGDEAGFWTPNTTKGGAKVIKLYTSGSGATNGHFAKDLDYYIALLPQTVSGLEITLKKSNGSTATRTINGPIALNRSKIKKLAHPVDSALFQPTNYIELDCTDASTFAWGSEAAFPTRINKASSDFDFWLSGQTDYVFHGNVYNWNKHLGAASGSDIQLPNIEGYELSELMITSQYNTKQPTYAITDGTNTLVSFQVHYDDKAKTTTNLPHTMTIPTESTSPERPNRYIHPNGEMNMKFKLKYVPVSE